MLCCTSDIQSAVALHKVHASRSMHRTTAQLLAAPAAAVLLSSFTLLHITRSHVPQQTTGGTERNIAYSRHIACPVFASKHNNTRSTTHKSV